MARAPAGVSELVGSTPIVELTGLLRKDAALGVRLFEELEALNSGGSVKDRVGASVIEGPSETALSSRVAR